MNKLDNTELFINRYNFAPILKNLHPYKKDRILIKIMGAW